MRTAFSGLIQSAAGRLLASSFSSILPARVSRVLRNVRKISYSNNNNNNHHHSLCKTTTTTTAITNIIIMPRWGNMLAASFGVLLSSMPFAHLLIGSRCVTSVRSFSIRTGTPVTPHVVRKVRDKFSNQHLRKLKPKRASATAVQAVPSSWGGGNESQTSTIPSSFPNSTFTDYHYQNGLTPPPPAATTTVTDAAAGLQGGSNQPDDTPVQTSPTDQARKAAYSVLAIDPAEIELVTIEETSMTDEQQQQQSQQQTLQGDPTNGNSASARDAMLAVIPFVSMFRGSANYIANHRNTIVVLHIPGDLLDLPDPNVFRDLMNDVALTWLLGVKIVLVVGCRYQIEKRLGEKGGEQIRLHGLRITDQDSLRVVKEEAGYVRFEVERQLARSLRMQGSNSKKGATSSSSSPSAGVGGYFDANVLSGNFYSAQPFGVRDGIDYQYTGFVRRVEAEKIKHALDSRDICLLTTLGVSPSGEVFNCNSESLAAAVAGSLAASKVIYFTEKEMELRHKPSKAKIQHLRVSDARNLLRHFDVSVHKKGYVMLGETLLHQLEQKEKEKENGMSSELPLAVDEHSINMLIKFGFSMQALEQGVKRAHIISPKHGSLLQELYTRDGSGTLISADLYEGIRRADVTDVAGIHDLISPLIKMGTLIDRPKATLEKDIDSYYVLTRDNHIVACGQLKPFENGFAEIGCLVVNRDYRSRGRGDAILGFLERLCLMNGCSKIFVLSTQTMEWFVERGFEEVDVERLPPSRQATYNFARRSKIYLKKIESPRDLDASELWWNR